MRSLELERQALGITTNKARRLGRPLATILLVALLLRVAAALVSVSEPPAPAEAVPLPSLNVSIGRPEAVDDQAKTTMVKHTA